MGYRILCDEHVEPQTIHYLSRGGHEAWHVQEVLSLGADDREVAAFAREKDAALLTNDRGFLDDEVYPDLSVLLYSDNRAQAYELAGMIDELTEYVPNQDNLPRVTYLNG